MKKVDSGVLPLVEATELFNKLSAIWISVWSSHSSVVPQSVAKMPFFGMPMKFHGRYS